MADQVRLRLEDLGILPAEEDPVWGCWLYKGKLHNGYARIYRGDGSEWVHRIAYVQVYGPVPDGKEVGHECRRRNCFRPEHLVAETKRENIRNRSWASRCRQAHRNPRCRAGHDHNPFSRLTPEGGRVCLRCMGWK